MCQHHKLISIEDCPHKQQFKNPENIVLAPDAYLWTHRIRDYNPDLVIVDDSDLLKTQDLPTCKEMNRWLLECATRAVLSFAIYKWIFVLVVFINSIRYVPYF